MGKKTFKGVTTYLHKLLVNRDVYGESIGFQIEGETEKKSISGALVFIFILITVGMYGLEKILIMQEFGDTSYQQNTEIGVISPEESFTQNKHT